MVLWPSFGIVHCTALLDMLLPDILLFIKVMLGKSPLMRLYVIFLGRSTNKRPRRQQIRLHNHLLITSQSQGMFSFIENTYNVPKLCTNNKNLPGQQEYHTIGEKWKVIKQLAHMAFRHEIFFRHGQNKE